MLVFSLVLAANFLKNISCYEANIHRNSTHRKAVFVKRLDHSIVTGATVLSEKLGVTYDQCTINCLRHAECKSFNLETTKPFTCQLLDKMVFDADTFEVYKEDWNNYDPGPVLLPCLARLYNMPQPLTHRLFKDGLTDLNADGFCDMTTDGGELYRFFPYPFVDSFPTRL